MSIDPLPVETGHIPFVPTTTPAIERANRLISVQAHPGFLDLIRISQEMVQTAIKQCIEFPGWDDRQIVVLKVRMQAAEEHHQAWLVKIKEAIEEGTNEARAQVAAGIMPVPDASDSIDHGDFVRQRVLERFEEADGRVPGSY